MKSLILLSLLVAASAAQAQQMPPALNRDLGEVTVQGQRERTYVADSIASIATRTPVPLLKTAQAVQVVPKALWQDQNAVTLSEVSRNMVGVAASKDYTYFVMRGFTNYNPGTFVTTDGLRGSLYHYSQQVLLYNVEQMEVLRGPASVLYANNTPGGVINLTSKLPLARKRFEVNATGGSWNQFTGFVDATGPLTADQRLKGRLVVGGETGESYRDRQYRRNVLVAPSLRFDVSEHTSVAVEGTYLYQNTQAAYDNGTYVRLRPNGKGYDFGQVDRSFSAQGPDTYGRNRNYAVSGRARHRFSEHFSLNLMSRYVRRDFTMLEASAFYANPTIVNDSLRRYGDTWDSRTSWFNNSLYGLLTFNTGTLIRHQVLVGADYGRERTLQNRYISKLLPSLALAHPDYSRDKAYFFDPSTPLDYADDNKNNARNLSGYVQDQVGIGEKVTLSLALRYNDYRYLQQPVSALDDAGVEVKSSAGAWVPRVGVVVNPLKNVALYASYTESFEPQASSAESRGGPFPPKRGKQWEVGYKGDFLAGRLSTSAAWYFIRYVNVLAPDPADPQGRRQLAVPGLTSTGVELSAQGQVTSRLSGIVTYATMNVKNLEDSPLGARDARPYNTPEYVGNVWLKYQFGPTPTQGFGVGAGVSFQGDKIGRDNGRYNPLFVLPAWQTLDASLSYGWRVYTATLTGSNLLDERYFTGSNSTSLLSVGAPRGVRLNLRAVF